MLARINFFLCFFLFFLSYYTIRSEKRDNWSRLFITYPSYIITICAVWLAWLELNQNVKRFSLIFVRQVDTSYSLWHISKCRSNLKINYSFEQYKRLNQPKRKRFSEMKERETWSCLRLFQSYIITCAVRFVWEIIFWALFGFTWELFKAWTSQLI